MKFREIIRLIEDDGWRLVAQRGSHRRYEHPTKPGKVIVAGKPNMEVPKAGVFAEGAARVVAASLIAGLRGGEQPGAYDGLGSCYIEFGGGRVGRVDVDFFSGPSPTGTFQEPSVALVAEKEQFGSSRRARWFDRH